MVRCGWPWVTGTNTRGREALAADKSEATGETLSGIDYESLAAVRQGADEVDEVLGDVSFADAELRRKLASRDGPAEKRLSHGLAQSLSTLWRDSLTL